MNEYLPECGEGWNSLINAFYKLCEQDIKQGRMPDVEVHQIKEKFGALRIYYGGGNERTDAYVRFAEYMSSEMCEQCGAPSSIRSKNGWYTTRCEEHIA